MNTVKLRAENGGALMTRQCPYHNAITRALTSLKAEADPRHVEAFMRLQYGTLDHLDQATFRRETKLALACIAEGGADQAEQLARSYEL